MVMIFIETPIFTKRLRDLLDDESYSAFQRQLADHPDMGDVIQGTGGLRKIRVASSGRGKRGGARVIYYHFVSASRIALLLIYAKNEKDDLSPDERKALKRIIEQWR
ncbi:type II toxin-antitoxin system RelE/ParE family toxin [Alloalcanivorax mobilis]|uniref:type II toxin-antitoxin system RelE/ParE family toxin n=1 Tax=Alloalcanivorax mobilis TaxID=2019569 RepID=UPI0018E4C49A|nr:type II toxin-antitoxin system RelE/ParE family toxin [Alloalcanivorax mobilis]|tara:strand:- start:13042 stop:13362 length:321 start_codon:yes stop_codon:yes gene_type:complete